MSTIVTRAGKGSPLTNNEVDANFTNLNTDKFEKSGDIADYLALNTAATTTTGVAKVRWNTATGTAALGLVGGNVEANLGQQLYAYVTNAESVQINKGQPVYLFGAQGDRATVKLAFNTSDATSAKTLGVAAENIVAGQPGLVICQGVVSNVDTSAYAAGDTLYLGATAGTLTSTKPVAPNHLVYIGVVEKSNAGAGQIYVRAQNGYELDEIHDVLITSVADGQVLRYDSATSLWKNQAATSLNTASAVVSRDASGNFSAGTITANLTGTATTATNQSGGTVNATTGAFSGQVTGKTGGTDTVASFYANTTGGAYATVYTRRGVPYTAYGSDTGSSYKPYVNMIYGHNSAYDGLYSLGVLNEAAANPGSFNILHINSAGTAQAIWGFQGSTGNFTSQGNVTAYSDERLKKDWAPVAIDFIERLAQVKSGTYTRIDSGERQAGASAQDMQKLLAEVVNTGSDEEKTLSLAYGNAALVAAIELAKQVVELKKEIELLKAR